MTREPEGRDGAPDHDAEIDPYLWDGSGKPDPAVAKLEQALKSAQWSPYRMPAQGATARPAPRRAVQSRRRLGLALAATITVIAAAIWATLLRAPSTGWTVESLAGSPGLGDRTVSAAAALPTGTWLRTDAASRARLVGANVGTVTVEPGSDLRLLKAAAGEHRLELAQGSISAFVTTPPKVFFVNTPAATAVDMGCAYKLNVDPAGEGVLYVSLGWVELHDNGREVRVPAGAACRIGAKTGPTPGPGTPWFEDAGPDFAAALKQIDAGASSLPDLLAAARARDSLTLWHLASRLQGADHQKVATRLAELVPPPAGIDPTSLDAAAMNTWWPAVRASW
jgi:hypothetical protein